jgi:hypothetical protein
VPCRKSEIRCDAPATPPSHGVSSRISDLRVVARVVEPAPAPRSLRDARASGCR